MQAVVFVVGGGNYIEYQNLIDYTKVSLEQKTCHNVLKKTKT